MLIPVYSPLIYHFIDTITNVQNMYNISYIIIKYFMYRKINTLALLYASRKIYFNINVLKMKKLENTSIN